MKVVSFARDLDVLPTGRISGADLRLRLPGEPSSTVKIAPWTNRCSHLSQFDHRYVLVAKLKFTVVFHAAMRGEGQKSVLSC